MCGFVGWVGPDADPASVNAGVEAITHRGPDASGVQERSGPGAARGVLGSVRLRIIDLSPEGDQPMSNEDGTVWVSFNGELYNHAELRTWLERAGHRFRSRTDTECLVHAYEEHADEPERFLERLRGMFAIALWDERRGRLLMARDRLGIKPLYLTEPRGGGVAFGSEVRALVKMGAAEAAVDPEAVRGYLLRGVVPGPGTILQGVRELPAGWAGTWTEGTGLRMRPWWTPAIEPDHAVDADAERALAEGLEDSVTRHLISDRPAGVFLSSGVDSGAIATVAARGGGVRTFTVTFPDLGDDEGDAAEELAGIIGAEHQRVPVESGDIEDLARQVLAGMDQPTHDGVNSWLVCRAAREAGLVVALSGLGGDELFGGYPSFEQVPKVARIRGGLGAVPRGIRDAAARRIAARAPGGKAARVLSSAPGVVGAYAAVRGLFSPAEVGAPPQIRHEGIGPDTDVRDAVTILEATNYMADQTLRDTDQMSMAHSLEVRVPLLDDDLVRIAFSMSSAVRTQPGKALLARASGLPRVNRKRPFALPFDAWIAGPLHDMVHEGLMSEALPFAELVPRELRSRVWDATQAGRVHWSRPWAITALRMWPGANGLELE